MPVVVILPDPVAECLGRGGHLLVGDVVHRVGTE
jgi:hypothetical protein